MANHVVVEMVSKFGNVLKLGLEALDHYYLVCIPALQGYQL
jgi:hypothetical protein